MLGIHAEGSFPKDVELEKIDEQAGPVSAFPFPAVMFAVSPSPTHTLPPKLDHSSICFKVAHTGLGAQELTLDTPKGCIYIHGRFDCE